MEPPRPRVSRAVALLGTFGIPLLVIGELTFNPTLCLVGGAISLAAVLLHVAIVLYW